MIILLLLTIVLLWRFIPQSAAAVVSLDKNEIDRFELTVSIPEKDAMKIYTLNSENIEENLKDEITELIYNGKYWPIFRNLILTGSKSTEGQGSIITVILEPAEEETGVSLIYFFYDGKVAVLTDTYNHINLYLTNKVIAENLKEYITIYGQCE